MVCVLVLFSWKNLINVSIDRPVILRGYAHGVPKSVPGCRRFLGVRMIMDATCPLVTKVHNEAARHHRERPANGDDRPCRPP